MNENTNIPNEDKTINIKGTGTRYMMKKVTKQPRHDVSRKNIKKWNIPNEYMTRDNQLECLNMAHASKFATDTDSTVYKIIAQEINKKIGGYKQQDKLKKVYNQELMIQSNQVINLLRDIKMECLYCNDKCVILYQTQREHKQWTLDRIDNKLGHYVDNVIISCLECNLMRRCRTKEDFLFTKQLKIVKSQDSQNTTNSP